MSEDGNTNSDTDQSGVLSECPICEKSMKREWHSYEFSYGLDSNATEIRVSAPSFTCDECDLHFSTPEGEELKHEAVCTYFGVLSPREIRSIREFNGLSREQFARITGLGKGSLARWERGGNFRSFNPKCGLAH